MTGAPEAILLEQLAVADRMQQHLERSWQEIQQDVPMSSEQVANLSNAAIDRIDLFLGRFGKLHDFMAGKLFRALARASLEDTGQDISLLDTLNRMEKFGVLKEIDDWLRIRLLRNAFAHEYLTDNAAIAENINAANELYPLLAEVLERSRDFYRLHIAR